MFHDYSLMNQKTLNKMQHFTYLFMILPWSIYITAPCNYYRELKYTHTHKITLKPQRYEQYDYWTVRTPSTNAILIPCNFSSTTSQCFQQQLLMLNMDWSAVLGLTHQNTVNRR